MKKMVLMKKIFCCLLSLTFIFAEPTLGWSIPKIIKTKVKKSAVLKKGLDQVRKEAREKYAREKREQREAPPPPQEEAAPQPVSVISGIVRDGMVPVPIEGPPVEGATVEVKKSGTLITSTLTDAQGQYSVQITNPTGVYHVAATKAGFLVTTISKQPTAPQNYTQNIILQKQVIRGLIKNSQDQPISGASVSLDGLNETRTTGEDGTYIFDTVVALNTAQSANVSVTKEGFATQTQNVNLSSIGFHDVNFTLSAVAAAPPPPPAVGIILGHVFLDEGTRKIPVPEATLSYTGPSHGSVKTNNRGEYRIENLPQGTYSLFVSESSAGTSDRKSVSVLPGKKPVKQDFIIPDTEEEMEIEVED